MDLTRFIMELEEAVMLVINRDDDFNPISWDHIMGRDFQRMVRNKDLKLAD